MTLVAAFALVFFWAPLDADQGFIQKIFYVHVPLAIVALIGFVAGGIYGDPLPALAATARHDLRSYVAIHMALIFGVGALITGSIWAQGGMGPLVAVGRADARLLPDRLPAVRVLPAAALLHRGPGAPGPLRGGVRRSSAACSCRFNFMAVRSATADIHPRTLSHADTLPGAVLTTFLLSLGSRWRCCT